VTALDLITLSLTDLGVIAAGETPAGADAELCLQVLQGFIDYLGSQRLTVWTITRAVFNLTTSQTYTLGPGGTFDTTTVPGAQRPQRTVYRAGIILPGFSLPLEKPLHIYTDADWANVRMKTLSTTFPTGVYLDYAYPLCNVTYWPAPTEAALQGTFYIPSQVAQVSALSTELVFPPGYQEMLEFGLAVRLAPKFGRPVPPYASAMAISSMNAIKAVNQISLTMKVDPAIRGYGGSYNILDDNYDRF
jgi:hypothetical protein